MKWNDLTMKERSDLMSLFLKHGIGSLSDMRRIYDGEQDTYGGGTLPAAQKSATLTRDQWNNLYRQGKVSLAQIPRKYQSWIEGENSDFKKGVTEAIDRFGTKYVAPVYSTLLSLNPVAGVGIDILDFSTQAASGNLIGMASTAATSFLPDFLAKPAKRAIGTFLDNNSKLILKSADKISPRLGQWLRSPTPETSKLFQKHLNQEAVEEMKKDMLNFQVIRDMEYGVPESEIPYGFYDEYIMKKNFIPASRLNQWINTLGATNSVTGRSRAGARYNPHGDIEFFREGLRGGEYHPKGIAYHELDHGAEKALKEAAGNPNYIGRRSADSSYTMKQAAEDILRSSPANRRSLEEFTADIQYLRGMEGQFGGFNSWPPEVQIRAQDFMAKRYGITADEAGYLMNMIDVNLHKYGGKLKKKSKRFGN